MGGARGGKSKAIPQFGPHRQKLALGDHSGDEPQNRVNPPLPSPDSQRPKEERVKQGAEGVTWFTSGVRVELDVSPSPSLDDGWRESGF